MWLFSTKSYFGLDPSVVALLVSSLLGLMFAPFMCVYGLLDRFDMKISSLADRIHTLHNRFTHHYFTTLAFEVASLFLLWVLWLGSTAAATVRHTFSISARIRYHTYLGAILRIIRRSGQTSLSVCNTVLAQTCKPWWPLHGSAGLRSLYF